VLCSTIERLNFLVGNTTQMNLQIQWAEIGKLTQKLMEETLKRQNNIEKENEIWMVTLPNFKSYCKVILVNKV
jgi:hypothetical protein